VSGVDDMSGTSDMDHTSGTGSALHHLRQVVEGQHAGEPVGVTSVCSAHPLVLEAAAAQARDDGSLLLVEATSNQVDQFGGYTGLRPADFRDLVLDLAEAVGLPRDRVVLGGDHLGPNTWRDLGADEAMVRSEALVRAYVEAGFTQIHLDCSMACTGDETPLTDAVVAGRAARLARVAEDAAVAAFGTSELVYVVGTEVPVPGGAQETIEELTPTTFEAAQLTLEHHRKAFGEVGAAAAWDRVLALVVQPGVEFDHLRVVDYLPDRTKDLQQVLANEPHLVFEAHSTDYQTVDALAALVRDHWAVLKVGPGLTFALREALFALAAIESELLPADRRSRLPEVLDEVMLESPRWWQGYYAGTPEQQRLARRYSYSDRSRYYWPDERVEAAQATLFVNLTDTGIPLPLLSQHLPDQYTRVREGALAAEPRALVLDRVRDVLRGYARACTPTAEEPS
jgi:D-tagatose-1,6-bisphosphate aldolase subunit GatZ/KbaZ